jgi:ring-1,2-phenylacetyl-CoA epoxidase subunit PaaA
MEASTRATDSEDPRAGFAGHAVVERPEEMAPQYRRELRKMLLVAADTEFRSVPMLLSYFDVGVPYRYLNPILAVAQDELGHAHIDYRLLGELDEDVESLIVDRSVGEWHYPYLFDMPIESWADIAVVEGLGEYAGGLLVRNVFHHCSYGPWRRLLAKVDLEENFHVKFGQQLMRELAAETESHRQLQEAVDWIFPLLIEFFGPPSQSPDPQLEYRLKGKTTDELRFDYLTYAVPFCDELKLVLPAHVDTEQGRAALDCAFPAFFDPEAKTWDLGTQVEWSAVFARWRERGPRAREHLAWIQSGARSVTKWLAEARA